MEEWKPIILLDSGESYEGLYEVSNLGRVKSLYEGHRDVYREKILKLDKTKRGYLRVRLFKNSKSKSFLVSRLVAFAFVDGWFEGAEVDHLDTNPLNNRADNIRWCSHKENCNNELTRKHHSEGNKGRHLSEENKRKLLESRKGKPTSNRKILCIELNKVFNSIREASEVLEISYGGISKVCRGKLKSTGGYHFKYAD